MAIIRIIPNIGLSPFLWLYCFIVTQISNNALSNHLGHVVVCKCLVISASWILFNFSFQRFVTSGCEVLKFERKDLPTFNWNVIHTF